MKKSIRFDHGFYCFRGYTQVVAAVPAQQNVNMTSIAAYKDRMVRLVQISFVVSCHFQCVHKNNARKTLTVSFCENTTPV